MNNKNVNTSFDIFHNMLMTSINEHAPERERRSKLQKNCERSMDNYLNNEEPNQTKKTLERDAHNQNRNGKTEIH